MTVQTTFTSQNSTSTQVQNPVVLFLDDNQVVTTIVKHLLKKLHYSYIHCQNGWAGLQAFHSYRNTIQLIITDFKMPEMKGDEFAKKVREEVGNEPIPIVCVTSEDSSQIKDPSVFTQVIPKPHTLDKLRTILQTYIGLQK